MILVVGATGLVGTEVCRQLVADGQHVRALVRPTSDRAKIAALEALPAEIAVGDVRDPASLARACKDVDAVVCTISAMPFSYQPGVNDIATVDEAGVRALIDTVVTTGIRRFVYLSFSGGIDRPFPLRNAKRAVERHLQASALDWTILRPSCFMEVWLSPAVGFDPANGTATVYGTGDAPISWISLRDVASFIVASLANQATSRRILELGGPRPIAAMEAIRIFETALGRPISPTFVPVGVLDDQMASATDGMAASFAGLMRCCADGDAIEMGSTADILAKPMTSVEAFATAMRPTVATS